MKTKTKTQEKPTLDKYADLVGTPFFMRVGEAISDPKWTWEVSFDGDVPEWAMDCIEPTNFDADGRCSSLAEAQDAALKAARSAFKKYKKAVAKFGAKLSREIAKDLAKLEKMP